MIRQYLWIPILRWIGVDGAVQGNLEHARLVFDRPALVLFFLIAMLPIAWSVHRRQQGGVGSISWKILAWLTATRVTIVVLLVAMLAGPRLAVDAKLLQKPILGLIFDRSLSMHLPADLAGSSTRIEAVETALSQSLATFLDPLASRFEFRPVAFGRDAVAVGMADSVMLLPVKAPTVDSSQTAIGTAIEQLLVDSAGKPMAGAVIFSDGQNSTGPAPVESARRLAERGGGVFCVAVGPKHRIADLAIVDATAPGSVFVGDTARIAVTLQSHGFDGKAATVRLLEGAKLLESRDLVLRDGEQQRIELSAEFTEPGDHYLTVETPTQIGEFDVYRSNNVEVVPVHVTSDKLRVMYLEGRPRWDFRFLKNAMRRDRGLIGLAEKEPEILLESELSASEMSKALSHPVESLARYHSVVIGDVSPKFLTEGVARKLTELVRDKGVGLIMAAGPAFVPQKCVGALRDLLPLRFDVAADAAEPGMGIRMALTPEGTGHEVMQLSESADSIGAIWSDFPKFYWLADGKPRPGASVLANAVVSRAEKGPLATVRPVIAIHQLGKGKVLWIGMDSTWRWRQNVGDRYFYRFWRQAMQFVSRDDPEITNRTRISLRPRRLHVGDTVEVELLAFDAERRPRTEPRLTLAVVSGESERAVSLAADSRFPGRYVGKWLVDQSGSLQFRFGEKSRAEASLLARVAECPDEYRKPNVQRELLAEIAAAGGGKSFELGQLADIPAQIRGEPRQYQLRKDASLWDNWLVLAFAMTVYALDIGIRRLNGLS